MSLLRNFDGSPPRGRRRRIAYSVSDEISLNGGLFFGFGDDATSEVRTLPSEYGLSGTTAYASFSIFF